MPSHFIIGGEEFPLVTRIVSIAGRNFPLALVPNESLHLDRIIRVRGIQERVWPYWLEEWPATVALAETLEKEDSKGWKGDSLDLGCGSGFLSVYLTLRFGLRPFSCDFNQDACRLAAFNIQQVASKHSSTQVKPLVFCADLGSFPIHNSFGLIVAGDLLYTAENHGPILGFLKRHLALKGVAFLADPARSSATGFSEKALAAGFQVQTLESRNPENGGKLHVYRLNRPWLN
jgi:SAM-dependent methyltransferase